MPLAPDHGMLKKQSDVIPEECLSSFSTIPVVNLEDYRGRPDEETCADRINSVASDYLADWQKAMKRKDREGRKEAQRQTCLKILDSQTVSKM